jgi:hypothetical protein
MLTDTQMESMLEEHFASLAVPANLLDGRTIIALSRRRHRRRAVSLTSVAAVAVSLAIVLPLALSGTAVSNQGKANDFARLASYRFHLPHQFHLVDTSAPSHCWAVAVTQAPFSDTTAPIGPTPFTNEAIANGAASQGSCVAMAITSSYVMSGSGTDPYEVSGAQSILINSYNAWTVTTTGWNGLSAVDLGVQIPLGGGEYQDVVIGSLGLTLNAVETIVASGLSTDS